MKLFGRKIVFPENGGDIAGGESNGGGVVDEERKLEADEDQEETELSEINPQDKDQNPEDSNSDENPKTPSIDEDVMSENDPEPETEQNGTQKTLKKPDKILPCPRCNSMDTKFCYYNNYNVNQPRHFCKSCQRYWTAGGTMRNVPVGAGRRKNKNSTSHCHHITISQALEAARVDSHDPSFKPNATFLSFGPAPPVSSVLDPADKRVLGKGCRKIDQPGPVFQKDGENVDDSSNGSSVTTSDGGKNGPQKPVIQNLNGFPYPVPCIPTVPWAFPVYPPGYPIPFYPGPYWNVPWISIQPPTSIQKATSSTHNSPLGKHSRDGELINRNNSESSIVVPKTLRIDDPEDAAKSSIWETLGIKYDSISREGLFKALQPKVTEKKSKVSASLALHANPAAMSRSINFQEGA